MDFNGNSVEDLSGDRDLVMNVFPQGYLGVYWARLLGVFNHEVDEFFALKKPFPHIVALARWNH